MAEEVEPTEERPPLAGLRKLVYGGAATLWIWIMYVVASSRDWITPDTHFDNMVETTMLIAVAVLGANVVRHGLGAWEARGAGGGK